MRLFTYFSTRLSSVILLIPSLAIAISLNCKDVRVDGVSFNFKPLGGPHSLYRIKEHSTGIINTTFTLDICQALGKQKGVPEGEECPNGSNGRLVFLFKVLPLSSTKINLHGSSTVCAIERLENTFENVTTIIDTVPIAGEFLQSTGEALDPRWTRLKSSASHADKEKEGVRLEMHGGKDSDGQKQKAIVEFLCDGSANDDRRRHLLVAEEEEDEGNGKDGEKEGEEVDDEHGGKLKFLSWDVEEGTKVLRLEWTTKYGCENVKDDKTRSSDRRWGEFLRIQNLLNKMC